MNGGGPAGGRSGATDEGEPGGGGGGGGGEGGDGWTPSGVEELGGFAEGEALPLRLIPHLENEWLVDLALLSAGGAPPLADTSLKTKSIGGGAAGAATSAAIAGA